MKPYTKLYLDYFGYDTSNFISCEVCGAKAVDINHIQCRGMGGTKKKDVIENLMAMCRKCHLELADKKQHKQMLIEVHNKFMQENGK